jgi:predicted lipoprotein with Yx(FWY)xxD motif
MKRKITFLAAAAAALAIALFAVGYGSSAASPTSSAAGKATRLGSANSTLGRLVVDGSGRTLYLFEKDKNRHSACYGACAQYWPPLLTHGKPVARVGVKQSLLGTTRRRNGTQQVTYAGHPLYRYVGDTGAGQTNGAGLQDFGGGWDPISPSGKKIESGG